jgi:hypothetical protein
MHAAPLLIRCHVFSVCLRLPVCFGQCLQGCLTAMYVPAGSDNIILRVSQLGLTWQLLDTAASAVSL